MNALVSEKCQDQLRQQQLPDSFIGRLGLQPHPDHGVPHRKGRKDREQRPVIFKCRDENIAKLDCFFLSDNFTPLLLASAEGNAEAVELLLSHGADIFALDKEDKSALYWAAAQNHITVVEVLLKDLRSRKLLETCDR